MSPGVVVVAVPPNRMFFTAGLQIIVAILYGSARTPSSSSNGMGVCARSGNGSAVGVRKIGIHDGEGQCIGIIRITAT